MSSSEPAARQLNRRGFLKCGAALGSACLSPALLHPGRRGQLHECRTCEADCPYGAIRHDGAAHIVTTCDFCFEELDAGRPSACVAACPDRALDFGDLPDMRKKYGTVDRVFPLAHPAQRSGTAISCAPASP